MNESGINFSKYFENFLMKSIIAFDKEGKVLYISEFAKNEFDEIFNQLDGKKLTSVIHPLSLKKFENYLYDLDLHSSKNNEAEFVLKSKKSNNIFVKFNTSKVFDNENNLTFMLAAIDNVSEAKKIKSNLFDINQKFKQIQSSAHIGLWKYNLIEQKLILSDEVYHIYNMNLGQEVNLSQIIELFYPYDRDKFQDNFELCLFEGIEFSKELRVMSKNEIVWVNIKGGPVFQADEIIGVYGTIQDITEIKNLQYDLANEAHSALQHKNILDSFAIVVKTDINGKINYVNDKFCEISGYDEIELIGQDHRILNSGHHPKEFFQQMWETIKCKKSWRGEIKNRAKDGSYYWVNTFITPLKDNSGAHLGFMAIRFDITHEKELEEQLEVERQRATISAQLASVGEMSTGIVHEINNPLSVIAGMNALLPKKINDEAALLKIHKSISNAIERMYHIIKGLKRLSHKSDQDKFELVPLVDLLEDSLGFIQESLKYNHIEFRLGDMPYDVLLECREVEISQVLLNLVNNGRDAINDSETEEKWIDVSFENLEKTILIKVTDSGPGIPPEIQDKIMEQFFTTKKVGKGTGLGLSLSARILKDHGGQLYLDKMSPSTTFVIELPKKLDAIAS